jgi:hypothetical protein
MYCDLFLDQSNNSSWEKEENNIDTNNPQYCKIIKFYCNPETYLRNMNCFLSSLKLNKGLVKKEKCNSENKENENENSNYYFIVYIPKESYDTIILPVLNALEALSNLYKLAEEAMKKNSVY